MNPAIILGAIVLVSWVALLWLRVPSSIAFLSLLIGQLVSSEASPDVYSFISSTINVSETQYVQLALLVLPLLLTILLLRNRVPKSKVSIEAIPLLFVVALTVMLIAPLLPVLRDALDTATKGQLDAYKTIIIIAASVSGLISAWMSYPKAHSDEHKKKH